MKLVFSWIIIILSFCRSELSQFSSVINFQRPTDRWNLWRDQKLQTAWFNIHVELVFIEGYRFCCWDSCFCASAVTKRIRFKKCRKQLTTRVFQLLNLSGLCICNIVRQIVSLIARLKLTYVQKRCIKLNTD